MKRSLKPRKINVKKTGKKQDFFERHFLNNENSDHTGSAKLDFTVYRNGTQAKGYRWSLSGGIELRDCESRIDLHFDGNTTKKTEELENSRVKLLRLKSICDTGLKVIDQMTALQTAHDEK